MKLRWIASFLLLTSVAFAAGTGSKLTLPAVPELGANLRTVPDALSWQLVNRTTILPSFEATVGVVDYTIAVEGKQRRVVWVSTQSPNFSTSDGFSVRSKVSDVLAKHPNSVVNEEGFGSFVVLSSGWSALLQREGAVDPAAKVKFFFRRNVTPPKQK